MIGTSILTVYQGHTSKASLNSSPDARRFLSDISASFLRSELILLFSRTKTKFEHL